MGVPASPSRPPRWRVRIGGMNDDWHVYTIVLIGSVIGTAIIVSPMVVIRLVIRWINRRDDPRHMKRPADPP